MALCRAMVGDAYLPPANVVWEGYVLQVCVCPQGGVLSQHALQMVSQHGLGGGGVSQHDLQVSRPTPKGEVEGDMPGGEGGEGWGLQAHTQGGS